MRCNFKEKYGLCRLTEYTRGIQKCSGKDCIFMKFLTQKGKTMKEMRK